MSNTIDQRVVEMRFDNKQFESATATSMSTIEKLKKSLNFTGASKGLEDVSSAAKKVDMSVLSGAVDGVKVKFSALQVMATTALANITNSAVNAGKNIVSALTIDPILTGFQEYETQINAVQTILANTQSKGTTLTQVNKALDELNKYADQTIYNFTEMTRNIGTFTAAGVDLDKSVTAIKGIANLAAVSGSTSQQASTAMYQLSQALAAGKVQLMDWNSVVNAGMGGEVFQNALKRTATQMGQNVDALIEKYGSFRDSLTKGNWLTADVLTETLTQLSGAYTEADLIAQGYSEKQAKEITQLAETAVNAATKVKTFTQLWDTLKEAAQSGWTETWEILVGDFEEAKSFLTELSETFGEIIGKSADARNTLLYDAMSSNWKKLTDEIDNAGLSAEDFKKNIESIAKDKGVDIQALVTEYGSLESAFKNGAISSKYLDEALTKTIGTQADVTKKIRESTKGMKNQQEVLSALQESNYNLSDEQLKSLGLTDRQVESIQELSKQYQLVTGAAKEFTNNIAVPSGRELLIDAIRVSIRNLVAVFETVGKAWREVFPPATAEQVYGIAKAIQQFALALRPSAETLDKLQRTFRGLFSILDIGKQAVSAVFKPIFDYLGGGAAASIGDRLLTMTANIGDFFTELNQGIKIGNGFSVVSDGITAALNAISDATGGVSGVLSSFGNAVSSAFSWIKDEVGGVVSWIKEHISAGDLFAGLAGGGVFVFFKKFSGLIDKIKGMFEGFGKKAEGGKFSEILESVHGSLESFQEGIKVASLVGIATAVTLLTSSLKTISQIDAADIAVSLTTIRLMIASLNSGFKSMSKALSKFNPKGVVRASISMIGIATAINILASAMQKLSDLSGSEIAKGLVSISVSMAALSGSIKLIGNTKVSLKTSVSILAIAQACKMLADAMQGFSGLSWDEIARGLAGMGGALAELTAVVAVMGKVGGGKSVLGATALLIAVQSLKDISTYLEELGNLSWEQIGRGLTAMGGALAEFTIALSALSTVGGFGSLLGGTAILIAAQSLEPIAEALQKLGDLSWGQIGKGLSAMGGALAEISVVTGALGKLAGFSGLLGAGALLIAVQGLGDIADALKQFGDMAWDEIGRGLTAMGGALAEIGIVTGALGKLAGFSGLLGAGSLLIAVQGLGDIADALQKFGSMQWDEIGRGLVAMGGAMAEIAVINGLSGTFAGFAGLVGAGTLALAVSGLDQLATAFQKFGSMSWDEIGRGLTAMGGAMGETAIGGLLNTFSGFGAAAIAEMAEPLGALADSIKKWKDVTVPEGLGDQIGSLADGVKAFNFAGWGADAIGPTATGVGLMADSIKKWVGVSIPESLGTQLSSLATGVKAFNFAGWGADTLSTVAPGLGQLAGAVQKWSSVTIPENLQTGLTGLANGVSAFSFAFFGGWSISSLVEPLSSLATTMSKWNDVTIPSNIDTGLQKLADGVGAFNFSFFGGWSIDGIVQPLSDLAGAVKKWSGISIGGVGDGLKSLASGLEALGDVSMKKMAGNVEDAAERVKQAIQNMMDGMSTTISSKKSTIVDTFDTIMSDSIKAITTKQSAILTAVTSMMTQFSNAIKTRSKSVVTAFSQMMDQSVQAVRSKSSSFYSAGAYIVQGLANGIKANQYRAVEQARAMARAVEQASNNQLGIQSPSKAFYAIGGFVVAGFVNAVKDKISMVIKSGKSLGESIIGSVRDTLEIDSSSSELAKKVIGETFVNGIAEGIEENTSAEDAAAKKAENIAAAFQNAFDKIDFSAETSDLEYQLWGKLNENSANDALKDAAQLENLNKEYQYQTERLELAKAKYAATIETFGKQSNEAQEVYNEVLQQQIDLVELSNQITSLKEQGVERERELNDKKKDLVEQEYSLWRQQNEATLTEVEQATADFALLVHNYEDQMVRAKQAHAEYQSTLSMFGVNATETVEAYSTYLDEYASLSELLSQLMEVNQEDIEKGITVYQKYASFMKRNQKQMEDQGYGIDEIHRRAMEYTGLDKVVQDMDERVKEGVTSAMTTVQNAYTSSVGRAFTSLTSNFEEIGASCADALGQGIQNGATNVTTGLSEAMSQSADALANNGNAFTQLGINAIDGFSIGIQTNIPKVNESAILVAQTFSDTLRSSLLGGGIAETTTDQLESSGPTFEKAGSSMMSGLIDGVNEMFGSMSSAISSLVTTSLSQIADRYHEFDLTGQTVIIKFLEGVRAKENESITTFRNFSQEMLTTLRNYYVDFVSVGEYLTQGVAKGITDGKSAAIQAAIDVAVAALEAAKWALDINSPSKEAASVGSDFSAGLGAGIVSGIGSTGSVVGGVISGVIGSIVSSAVGSMKRSLDSHSPSKVTDQIGQDFGQGFVNGILSYKSRILDGVSELSESAIVGLNNTVSRISEAIDSSMDTQPTIRPVLDLSDVEEKSKTLNTMLSRNLAVSANPNSANRQPGEIQNGDVAKSSSGNTFNLVQNNYSPKSLSRVEIYRQTKNQFSAMERMINK